MKSSRLSRFMTGYLWQLSWALAFTLALPLADYFRQSVTEVYPNELILLLLIYASVTAVIFSGYYLTLKLTFSRLLATLLAAYYLMRLPAPPLALANQSTGIVWRGRGLIFPALVLGGLYVAGFLAEWFIKRYRPKLADDVATVLRVICFIVLISNVAQLGLYLVGHTRAANFHPSNQYHELKLPTASNRDIYYIVLDRYASAQSLHDYYNFDNGPMMTYLKEQGFNVRNNAFANYQYTSPSLASTVRMDYHFDISRALRGAEPASEIPYRAIIENSPVTGILKSHGYDTLNLGSWWELTRQANQAQTVLPQFEMTIFGHRFGLTEFQSNVLSRTFLFPMLEKGWNIGSHSLAKLTITDQRNLFLNQISALQELAKAPHDKPRFVFAHIINPHPPYVFKADGSTPTKDYNDSDTDLARSVKYTDQMQFNNSEMKQVIETIKATAKQPPIIIIQADEGPYPMGYDTSANLHGQYQWQNVSVNTLKEKFGIMAAYYLPDIPEGDKAKLDSSVNAFRFIFNNYFGAELPYLPDCSFAYNLGDQPFKFYDITQKLHPSDANCRQYASP